MKTFVHGSVFSGIGAAELAATWMGWHNAFHCEIQEFPRRVLEYWFPNSESYDDITKTDFKKWRGCIDILTGGFPCQPFSLAGKRQGEEDNRYLWKEMFRAICEIQPTWVVAENVRGIVTMVQPSDETDMGSDGSIFEENHVFRKEQRFTLDGIIDSLERENYAVQALSIPACAVGAPHRRERIWIVAHRDVARSKNVRKREDGILSVKVAPYSKCKREHEMGKEVQSEQSNGMRSDGNGTQRNVADAKSQRCEYDWHDFPTQSPICRGNDGISVSLDNLTIPFTTWRQESIKAYGNAWVPQVAYQIFKAIESIND